MGSSVGATNSDRIGIKNWVKHVSVEGVIKFTEFSSGLRPTRAKIQRVAIGKSLSMVQS